MSSKEPSFSELVRRAYLCPDKRSLAFGRIVLGLVLLGDLPRYLSNASLWLGVDGLLPVPPYGPRWSPHVASVLFYTKAPLAVALSLGAAALFDVALVLGWRTKIVQALALVALVNIQSRVKILMNGGDRVLCLYLFWTLFLPMGDYFSLDARRRGHRPASASSGAEAEPSLAFIAVLLQLDAAYIVNAIRKTELIWVDGRALSQFFHDPTLTNTVGCALGSAVPLDLLKVVTHVARFIEYVAPLLIISPVYPRRSRHLAIVLLVTLHVGIVVTLNVGIFSYVMVAFYPMLLMEEDWVVIDRETARLRRWLAARPWGRAFASAWERARAHVPPDAPTRREPLKRALRIARDVVVAVFAIGCIEEGIVENTEVSREIMPAFLRAVVEYPNLHQTWGMFLGEHIMAVAVVVDAETVDGRHVDPLNEIVAPAAHEPRPWTHVPPCMNTSTFYQSYSSHFIAKKSTYPPLGAWILRYPERTGRPEDRILRYTIYLYLQRIELGDSTDDPPEVQKLPLYRYPDPLPAE